jgi:RimJ/RimL family protein N-acetyltransferase
MTEKTATRPAIQTARLALRPPRLADAPRLAELANDFDVVRMTGSMPYPFTLADAEAFVRRAGAVDRVREAIFALELPGEGPIGVLGFHPKAGEVAPEVGYWLGRRYWGRGFATEALVAAMDWATRAWGRRWVRASHFADNPASGAVLVKAGFLYTGEVALRPCAARGAPTPGRWMVWLA